MANEQWSYELLALFNITSMLKRCVHSLCAAGWVTPIDHMITNFGDQNTGRLLEAITAKYREVLRVNVNARIYVTGHSRGGALVSRQQLWLNVDADN